MLTEEDHQKIRQLRLSAFAERFFELTGDKATEHLGAEEVFMQAVEHALDIRRSHRVNKLIKQAGFPLPTASLAEVHYVAGRNLDEAKLRRYSKLAWRSDPTNLLIISPTGGGKTYLACALGIAACQNEYSVFYRRMDDLARDLLLAREDRRQHQQMLTRLRTR